MNEQKISVIICVYTEERLADIKEAVNSVLNQSFAPCEVIVSVDHNIGLSDTLKKEFTAEVKIVRNEGIRGLSETRNVGIRASDGEIIAFIDDDAVAKKDWLLHLTAPFKNKNVVAVGGKAIPLWLNGGRPTWFPEELDWIVGCSYKGLPVKGNEIRNVPGCNMAFSREAFTKAGLWENSIGSIGQSLKGGEEAELCIRIAERNPGSSIVLSPDAIIKHKVPAHRASLNWIWKNSFDQGRCKARLNMLIRDTQRTAFSTENSYLRYLLLNSIPVRLSRFYKRGSLTQIGAILVCITATAMGYVVGIVKVKDGRPLGQVNGQ